MDNLRKLIREVPDFPKEGINFYDITTLLKDADGLKQTIDALAEQFAGERIDTVIGVESRGFIFAALMAAKFNKGFLPLRKAGKLPQPVLAESYDLEYGKATLEIAPALKKQKVVVCDDVLATGGTLKASVSLCERAGYEVVDLMVLINLTFLNKMTHQGQPVKSLIQY